jgi:hypothetical protein
VSFAHPEQIGTFSHICQSFALDNGAFSAWKKGNPVTDWKPFYSWIKEWMRHPGFDWCLIPDVIDGDEYANDELVRQFPYNKAFGVPVWHMHESLDRLWRLRDMEFPRIAIGSSGEFAEIGTGDWWQRIKEAMHWLCDEKGRPLVKIHGLRMLNPKVFRHIPFSSADSTNMARNISLDSKWVGPYSPKQESTRGIVIADNIEHHHSSPIWDNDYLDDRYCGTLFDMTLQGATK